MWYLRITFQTYQQYLSNDIFIEAELPKYPEHYSERNLFIYLAELSTGKVIKKLKVDNGK